MDIINEITTNNQGKVIKKRGIYIGEILYKYDSLGRLLRKDDNGLITNIKYPFVSSPLLTYISEKVIFVHKTRSDGYEVESRYLKVNDKYYPISKTDSNNVNEYWKYDDKYRLTEHTYQSLYKYIEEFYSYDKRGNVIYYRNSLGQSYEKKYNRYNKETFYKDNEGHEVYRIYNKAHLLTKINNSKTGIERRYYDCNDRLRKIKTKFGWELYSYHGDSDIIASFQDSDGFGYNTTIDRKGNLSKKVYSDGIEISYNDRGGYIETHPNGDIYIKSFFKDKDNNNVERLSLITRRN